MSARGRKGPALLAGALVASVLAVAILIFGRSVERGRFAEAYSTFRATPEGAKAAFLVLQRLGYRVSRHTEETMALDGVDILFVLEPASLPAMFGGRGGLFSDDEVDALKRFVKEGGTLVLASTLETEVHRKFGVSCHGATLTAETEVVPALASAYSVSVTALAPDPHPQALFAGTATAVPIFRRASGRIEAVSVREGAGKAIFFADPSLFANRAIGRADNAKLLAAIASAHAGSGRIAFDEYHHGFVAERGVAGYLGRRSLAPALGQAAAAFLVLALALGGRRGRPLVLEEELPPQSREHIRGMAEIYAKAGLRPHCAERLHRSILRDVEAAVGSREPDALRRRGVKHFRGLEKIERRFQKIRAAGARAPEHELILLAREVARFEADCRAALGQRFGEV